MKFNYKVKHNGIYYNIGEDVPIEDSSVGASTPKVEIKVEEVKSEPIVESKPIVEDANDNKKYTKTEINRMSTKELRDLANSIGLKGDDYVGSELKAMLIEKLV